MSFKSNLSYASLLLVLTGIVTPNLILSTASHVTAQSVWRPFSPPGSGFSILMPGTPKEEVETEEMSINGKNLTHPPLKRRGISCYLLFVICYLYSLTNNKQQTTKRRTAIPPLPRRKGLPAAFCENNGSHVYK